MGLFHVDLGDAGVVFHHIESAVAEQRLQRKHIAARSQIRDRQRVAETMGMTFLDARFLSRDG